MVVIKEPDYKMEIPISQVEVNEELDEVVRYNGVERWVLGVGMFCKTCDERMCFDNGWHAGHIFYPHIQGDGCSENGKCEVEQTVFLGEETTEEARK